MRYIAHIFLATMIGLFLAQNILAKNIILPKGRIIYAFGNDSIYVLHFDDLAINELYKGSASFSGLSKINHDKFLFTENNVQSSQISEFNIKTNKISTVTQGIFPYILLLATS
jgi:hypothetical protein